MVGSNKLIKKGILGLVLMSKDLKFSKQCPLAKNKSDKTTVFTRNESFGREIELLEKKNEGSGIVI